MDRTVAAETSAPTLPADPLFRDESCAEKLTICSVDWVVTVTAPLVVDCSFWADMASVRNLRASATLQTTSGFLADFWLGFCSATSSAAFTASNA